MDPKFEKLCELFKDETIAKQLLSCSAEEATVILQEQYQLDFTVAELTEVIAGIKAALANEDSDELSSAQLDQIAGGVNGSAAYKAGYYIGKACKILVALLL